MDNIDVTSCHKLQRLHISDCSFSHIDISQCPELFTLSIANNKIHSLDLGNNKDLSYLYVYGNPIEEIDFPKLLKIEVVDISDTQISRVDLYNCYYLKSFSARNTKLEFVDFNAQQPERMTMVDLRDCSGFTPLSMAYTVKTLPVARTTMSTATSLYLAGSHPEIADIEYVTSPDMHWVCDSQGDGSADYPEADVTFENSQLTGERIKGYLERLYPYGGLSLEYDLEVHSAEGGKFLAVQWEPEWFQTVASISSKMRRGVPVCIYSYPDEGMQFKSVTVNGKEIFSDWFIIDGPATISVNFDKKENCARFYTEAGRNISFIVGTKKPGSSISIDWGTGSRTTYADINAFSGSNYDVPGTRIEGTTAGTTVTVYGEIAALDLSCYGEVGEEMFGFPNNHINAIDVTECPDLQLLNFYWNPVTSIDLSKNPDLVYLDASYSAISSLDISANTALVHLDAYANKDDLGQDFAQINSIDLSKNTALTYVDVHNQNLSSLDVSKQPGLLMLNGSGNKLSSIDVSANADLKKIDISRNNISEINLSANTALVEFSASDNNLSTIDLSKNPLLENVYLSNNNITVLDTHNLPELGLLYINGNGITAEQLNDIYYLLPERKYRPSDDDSMGIKSNLIVSQGTDLISNDANGADGSIAVARKWTPNVIGTNAASKTSYLDIDSSDFGTVTVADAAGNVYASGSTVPKYTTLSISAIPAEGYIFDGFSLNGEDPIEGSTFLMPGIYTVLTPVFTANSGVDDIENNPSHIYADEAGNIIVEANASSAQVYNTEGQLICDAPVVSGRATIATPVSGTYIVRVSTPQSNLVKKVIIKK